MPRGLHVLGSSSLSINSSAFELKLVKKRKRKHSETNSSSFRCHEINQPSSAVYVWLDVSDIFVKRSQRFV